MNGTFSIWSCNQRGIDAVCFQVGETRPPDDAVLKRLVSKGRSVLIVYDRDPAGRRGGARLHRKLQSLGCDAEVLILPDTAGGKGADVDDLQRKVGPKLADALEACERLSLNKIYAQTEREELIVDGDDEDIYRQLEEVDPDWASDMVTRLGKLYILDGSELRPVDTTRVKVRILSKRRICRKTKDGTLKPTDLRETTCRHLIARVEQKAAKVNTIVRTPVLSADGEWLDSSGILSQESAVLCTSKTTTILPTSLESGVDLLKGLFCDFPFKDDASLANLLGFVFTLPLALQLDGANIPLFLLAGNQYGLGKTRAFDLIHRIFMGEPVAVSTNRQDGDQLAQEILALLASSPPFVLLDNIRGTLDSTTLAAVLSQPSVRRRAYHTQQASEVPTTTPIAATSVGLSLHDEMIRRTVPILFYSDDPHPERRKDFKIPDIVSHVMDERPALLGAIRHILQEWHRAGCPEGCDALGSFERHNRLVGGVLKFIGVKGFLVNHKAFAREYSALRDAMAFFVAWRRRFGLRPVAAAKLVSLVDDAAADALEIQGDVTARRLGMALRRIGGRPIGEFRVTSQRDKHAKQQLWRLHFADSKPQ